MGRYTKEDILRMVEEEDIQFIRMQFTDIFGQLKMWPSLPPRSSGRWRARS